MTTSLAVGGTWIAVNAALVVLLLSRRDRPKARGELAGWILRGRNRAEKSSQTPQVVRQAASRAGK